MKRLTEKQVNDLSLNSRQWIAYREFTIHDDKAYDRLVAIIQVNDQFLVVQQTDSSIDDAYLCSSVKEALIQASKEFGVEDDHWDHLAVISWENEDWFKGLPRPKNFTYKNSCESNGFVYRYSYRNQSYDWKDYVLS